MTLRVPRTAAALAHFQCHSSRENKILLTCLLGSVFLSIVNAQSPADPAEATGLRITGKVEQVQAGVQKWAVSSRDPSTIRKVMEEKFKPLIEAEVELDRLLEQLGDTILKT